MTQEEKFEEAKRLYETANADQRYVLESLFPELKESEDERIRQKLIHLVRKSYEYGGYSLHKDEADMMTAWIEKQGKKKSIDDLTQQEGMDIAVAKCFDEQKHIDKVEPKFYEGEWITNGDYTWKIVEVKPLDYILQSQDGNIVDDTISHVDGQFHSFTIEDAKDGDVLAAHEYIVLFKEIDGLNIKCHCTYHFMNNPSFYVNTLQNKSAFLPATKEQRTSLFQKIKEAGYEWNTEELKLETIEQKYDVSDNDSEKRSVQSDDRDKGLSLSLQIQAYLNTASDELYAKGKPLYSEEKLEDIHKCMLMWQKLHNAYFYQKLWSKEDETKLNDAIDACKAKYGNMSYTADWLLSIKDRVVPQQQEWSEEDEMFVHGLIRGLAAKRDIHGHTTFSSDCIDITETIAWLKSLKDRVQPHKQWKPREIQKDCIEQIIDGEPYNRSVLIELFNDLKKL